MIVQYADKVYYTLKNYTEWFPKGAEEPEIKERIDKINNKCLNTILEPDTWNTPTDTNLLYTEHSLPEPMSNFWHEYGRKILLLYNNYDYYCGKCTHQHDKLCNLTETPDNLFKKYVVKRTEFLLDI